MKCIRLESANEIQECLLSFDDCYPSLINRSINIDAFSKKLATNGTVLVYRDSDIVKGVICFYENDAVNCVGYISILWINKDYRREGIGTKLMHDCLIEMEKNGMKTALLEVKSNNTRAISFYLKNGFKIRDKARPDSYYMYYKI